MSLSSEAANQSDMQFRQRAGGWGGLKCQHFIHFKSELFKFSVHLVFGYAVLFCPASPVGLGLPDVGIGLFK